MNVLVLFATFALGSSLASASQESVTLGSLTRARSVFDRIDTDGDETLSADEAMSIGIPEDHFRGEDSNGDQCVSRDEFSVYYFHLMVAAAEDVEADLLDEVAHIRALQLAQQPTLVASEPEPEEQPVSGPVAGPSTKGDSLVRARKLLVRLSAEAALSKAVTNDFRAFFWGRDPRGMPLRESLPALTRANAEIERMLDAELVTEDEARLLRTTLARRAGPVVGRASRRAGEVEGGAESVALAPDADGLEDASPSAVSVGSMVVDVPEFEVSRVETGAADEVAADSGDSENLHPQLQGDTVAGDEADAALAAAMPFFLRLAFPANMTGFASFMAGPNGGAAPGMTPDSMEPGVELESVEADVESDVESDVERGVEPPMDPIVESVDLSQPTNVPSASPVAPVEEIAVETALDPSLAPVAEDPSATVTTDVDSVVADSEGEPVSSVPIGLPSIQVDIDHQAAADVSVLPFFVRSFVPVPSAPSEGGVAPGATDGRPQAP